MQNKLERYDNGILVEVVPYSEEELQLMLTQERELILLNRKNAYLKESDPLFFKAQRGEATNQDWLDKIAEIKLRFPKGE